MTGEDKLKNLEAQVQAVELGHQHTITCPYCDTVNHQGDTFCCNLFTKAAMAIMQRKGVKNLVDEADRIYEKASRN